MLNIANEKGVTLVALVITIIVLLILAGVTMSLVINGGVIEQSIKAAEETRGASVDEEASLWKAERGMAGYTNGVTETLEEILARLQKQGILKDTEVAWLLNETENPDRLVEIGSRNGDRAISFKVEEKQKTMADLVDDNTIKIGDPVIYKPTEVSATYTVANTYSGYNVGTEQSMTRDNATNNLGWRVLDIKDGKVRLISDAPTTSTIYLRGEEGYNNAVKILDDLCSKLYNNTSLASKVQNLKIEDIQEYLNEKDYKNFDSEYGKTYTPSSKKYPSIFAKENKQLGNAATGNLGYSEQSGGAGDGWYQGLGPTVTTLNTAYTHWNTINGSCSSGDFSSGKYYELFMNNGSNYSKYWLSSRCVDADTTYASFDVRTITNNSFGASSLYSSTGSSGSVSFSVRPVIILKSSAKVTGGDSTTGWNIQ